LFAGEVIVETRRREIHDTRQVADGDAVDAAFGEQALRRIEDHLSCWQGIVRVSFR
jgi:hypothetical protein